MKPPAKAAVLGAAGYASTLLAAAVTSGLLFAYLDPKGCNALSRALLVLWAAIAAVMLISAAAFGVLTWRLELTKATRLAALASYAGALFVTYLLIAIALVLAFNC
jgi:hypothetical protein